MSSSHQDSFTLELTRDEALVLFDWLARFDGEHPPPLENQAEQRVLWNIEAALEKTLVEPLTPDYAELLAGARARVRDGAEEP